MGWDLYLTIEVQKDGTWKTVASDRDGGPAGRCNELARGLMQGTPYDYEGDRAVVRPQITGELQMMTLKDVLEELGRWDSKHVLERRQHKRDGTCEYVTEVREWIQRTIATHGQHGRLVYEMD